MLQIAKDLLDNLQYRASSGERIAAKGVRSGAKASWGGVSESGQALRPAG